MQLSIALYCFNQNLSNAKHHHPVFLKYQFQNE
jgi:hypothetical protein